MSCLKSVNWRNNTCLTTCNGLLVTGYTKTPVEADILDGIIDEYKNYKGHYKFPGNLKGRL